MSTLKRLRKDPFLKPQPLNGVNDDAAVTASPTACAKLHLSHSQPSRAVPAPEV